MRYDPDEYAKQLVPKEEQGVSYSDKPDYYATWVMELQWKRPDGTISPLVTIEVKDAIQRIKTVSDREY